MRNHIDYYIEPLNHYRLKDLASLHLAVYQRQVDPVFFEKKYATAYTGHQYIGFIAYNNNDEPVGYYGVIPCFLRYKGEKLLAAQSADTMTHPGYRFKGLFVELANLCYERCIEAGIRLIVGFPNQHSYHGAVNKLGWQIAGQMDCFTLPVNGFPLARIAHKTALTKRWFEQFANRILAKNAVEILPQQIANEGFDGICRDLDYQAYKGYHRHYLLQSDHVLCWIKLQDALVVGDMELAGEADFENALDDIRKLAKQLGYRKIQYHVSRDTSMHRLFSGQFAPVPTFPVLFRDLGFGQPLDRFRFSFADIDIF